MGMECVRSSSPVAWLHQYQQHLQRHHNHHQLNIAANGAAGGLLSPIHERGMNTTGDIILPHSAPASSLLSTAAACRRAASFPLASAAAATAMPLPSLLKIRSQSESAALNKLSQAIMLPRGLYDELQMCRRQSPQLHQQQQSGSPIPGQSGTMFYTPSSVRDGIQSDSEGDDSLVSSEEPSPSASGCEDHDIDDDLGVVRDLELDDNHGGNNNNGGCLLKANSSIPFLLNVIATSTNNFDLPMSASAPVLAIAPVRPREFEEPPTPPLPRTESEFRGDRLDASIVAALRKKSVRFADDCGECLETVRVMTEPSDYPPHISPAVLRRYRKAAAATAAAMGLAGGGTGAAGASSAASNSSSMMNCDDDDEDSDDSATRRSRNAWKMGFKQPASEYVKFRETLDRQKVALENVMLKNELGRMVGTIKVSNIAFTKRVFIRFTSDGWRSFLDRAAIYQSSPSKLFDIFRFDVELPRNEGPNARIEFCVCFVAGEADEHWDSNGGKNYALVSSDQPQQAPLPTAVLSLKEQERRRVERLRQERENEKAAASVYPSTPQTVPSPRRVWLDRDDAYSMDCSPDTWSKFASWKNLSTDGPYW